MKPAVLALTFLLFAFPVAFSNDAQPVPVLDITGKPVVSAFDYIIFTTLSAKQGLVTLGETGNSTSPATVEVSFAASTDAIPVKFIANTPEIFTDTPLQIEFSKNYTPGVQSPKWIVVGDSAIQQTYVGIGGPEDHNGQPTYCGTFKILKSSDNKYDLAFSLPIRVDELPVSWNIRLAFIDTDLGLLILTGNEPGFGFKLIRTIDYPGIRTVV